MACRFVFDRLKTSNKVVFFNAFACDPEKGSEFGLGWNWVTYVARYYPTLLVTADRGRNDILLDAIQSDPEIRNNLSVTFLPWKLPDDLGSRVLLKYFQPYYYVFYRRWMRSSFLLAQKMCQEGKIGLVHQNTYHTFREPGELWRLPIPSVWAPVAGVSNVPWSMLSSLGCVEGGRHAARNIIINGHKKYNLRFKEAVLGYSKVVAGSEEAAQFLRRFRTDVNVIPGQLIKESFVGEGEHNDTPQDQKRPLRFVFCGLHLSRKGVGYLIQALGNVGHSYSLHLDIIGEGSMTNRWMKQAESLGCHHLITWHGLVERSRVISIMRGADVFVFPSISDCYPAVIAEALSCGLPVITTDVSGVGDMVDKSCGFKVSAGSEREIVRGIQEAMIRLYEDRNYLQKLRQGVSRQVAQFRFDEGMEELLSTYELLLT